MAATKWVRDPGISELIEYFDQVGIRPDPTRPLETGWARIQSKSDEIRVVEEQIRKCRADFSYTARNFYWLTNKQMEDVPFRLWESQELIYEKMRQMKERGVAQKILICKARQLGCSTLIEAMIAWRTMFFPNVNALIVSNTPSHAAYLFRIMTHIYQFVPWWLRPMVLSHKIEEGLIFQNPDSDTIRFNPGLNSMIEVQAANQMSGVGQGIRVSAAHISEVSDFAEEKATDIIEGDLGNALADNKETFAVIESTARGAGTYFHRLWLRNVELAEEAGWLPLFLPWFFERTRRRAPRPEWRPDQYELDMQERIKSEWLRCDNPDCLQMKEALINHVHYGGKTCETCGTGIYVPYELEPDQLYWMYNQRINAEKDSESLKRLKQEQSSTAEEAFQLSGIQYFPQEVFDWVNLTIKPPIWAGYMDRSGTFHGVDHENSRLDQNGREVPCCPCSGCPVDHSYEDLPLQIWERPRPDYTYVIGVDVAEGQGKDYSVAFVNKVGKMGEPDEQVALFRSNEIDPVGFSYPLAFLGRWYNEALMSIEVNKYDTTFSYVRNQLQYTNLYRWKHMDSTNILSNKWGWWTNMRSRPRIFQTAKHWLKAKMWVIHSRNFYEELRTIQKEEFDDATAGAARGFWDDEAIAGFIALYTSHDADWDDTLGMVPIKQYSQDISTYPWSMECISCGHKWGANNPESYGFCRACGSPRLRGDRNIIPDFTSADREWDQLLNGSPSAAEQYGDQPEMPDQIDEQVLS